MTIADQMTEYVARPKPQQYGHNDPRRVAGVPWNHEPPSVSLPPGFVTNRRVSSPTDPHGDRLALGMARAHDFACVELGARDDLDAVAAAAVLGFVRGFGAARRMGPSRELRETEPIWRGVFVGARTAVRAAPVAGRYEALGAVVASAQDVAKAPRLDIVMGQLGAVVAVVDLLGPPPSSPAQGKMPRGSDRDWTGDRLRAGVAFARTQSASTLRCLAVTDVAEIAERAAHHYAAGFACFIRLERYGGRHEVQAGEIAGDGIKRAVSMCLPLVLDPPPGATELDVAYALGDQAIDCVIGDAGSVASCAGQVFASLAVVTALATVDRDGAARLCAAARKDALT